MPDDNAADPTRGLVWERVKKAAQAHHDHHKDRGTASLIARDAGKSAQYVSDWRHGRSPIPMATITKLAKIYGTSVQYLAGFSDDPTPTAPSKEADMRARMVALVEDVVAQLNPNANPTLVIEMCDLCMAMLKDEAPEEMILGALYKKMRAADADADAKAKRQATTDPGAVSSDR